MYNYRIKMYMGEEKGPTKTNFGRRRAYGIILSHTYTIRVADGVYYRIPRRAEKKAFSDIIRLDALCRMSFKLNLQVSRGNYGNSITSSFVVWPKATRANSKGPVGTVRLIRPPQPGGFCILNFCVSSPTCAHLLSSFLSTLCTGQWLRDRQRFSEPLCVRSTSVLWWKIQKTYLLEKNGRENATEEPGKRRNFTGRRFSTKNPHRFLTYSYIF